MISDKAANKESYISIQDRTWQCQVLFFLNSNFKAFAMLCFIFFGYFILYFSAILFCIFRNLCSEIPNERGFAHDLALSERGLAYNLALPERGFAL